MFERILYIISEKQEEKQTVLELAQRYKSTVLLAALSPVKPCPPPLTEGKTRQKVREEDYQRHCWQDIYRLEDEFKKSGVKASVVAQLGKIDDLHSLAHNTRCDIIVLPANTLADHNFQLPEELIPNLPCPIILMPAQ